MSSIMNRNVFWKCVFIGFYMTVEGMVLQVLKGQLFFHNKPASSIDFIIEVTILYLFTGFLFGLGYFITKNSIPGKSRVVKGLCYAFLVYFSVAFAGLVGIIGFDFIGRFDLLTPFKIENYAVTLTDFLNFMITGMVLGVIAEKKAFIPIQYRFNKKGIFISSTAGLLLFPTLYYLIYRFVILFIPSGLNIPKEAELWFYMANFIPLAVTGAMIPLFFSIVKNAFIGNGIEKGFKFFLFYYLCYWIINVSFGLPFGFSVLAVINFLISSIFPLLLLILFSAKYLEE